ncbi:MAG: hypothetical protein J6X58_03115 [Bacteroidales bacterium]|nr:hypothetical protein [Bacteroidales bacterium]
MKSIFFLVGGMEQYADDYGFHENFFETSGGFTTALIIAAAFAVICAIIYYFGLCMSRKTIKCATLPVWITILVLSGALTFVTTNTILIGSDDEEGSETSLTYAHSFYRNLEDYYIEISEEAPETEQEAMMECKNQIVEQLNQGEDVALMFNLNAAIYALIFFYIVSLIIKGISVNGRAIPHLWPHK